MKMSEELGVASGFARPQPEVGVTHTPGPWLLGKTSSIVGWPVVAPQAQGRMIANITFAADSAHDPVHPEHKSVTRQFNRESEANGRLIAAAPELLEALKALHLKTVVGTDNERHDALNAAWARHRQSRGVGPMNAPHPSIEQARPRKACVTHVSFEALEGAEEIERELLDTPLGMKLAELLTLAQDTHIKSEPRLGTGHGQRTPQLLARYPGMPAGRVPARHALRGEDGG